MNAVDTGWVTDENPFHIAEESARNGFLIPLDCEDGASRILDPIFYGMTINYHEWGKFFKNYRPTFW